MAMVLYTDKDWDALVYHYVSKAPTTKKHIVPSSQCTTTIHAFSLLLRKPAMEAIDP
jgi:hypothetical protein